MVKNILLKLVALGLELLGIRSFSTGFPQRSSLPRHNIALSGQSKTATFWTDGLQFSCTACGRCCQNEGEVWLDTSEVASLVDELKLPAEDVIESYVDDITSGWAKLKNYDANDGSEERCIFLSKQDGKTCTVYNSRPVQCRTYPFWPHLIRDETAWKEEKVAVDGSDGRVWSAAEGGCEGIERKDDTTVVPARRIHVSRRLYEAYMSSFPFTKTGNEKKNLLEKVDVVQRVTKATKLWVQEFVIGYRLCPFAEQVFSESKVRYVVSTVTDERQVTDKLRYEVLYLLAHSDADVETTLVMFPFLTPDFEKFYDLSLKLEDIVLPQILQGTEVPVSQPAVDDTVKSTKPPSRLQQRFNKMKVSSSTTIAAQSSKQKDGELQLAFFHPSFAWADSNDFNSPLNFEKRAPFPTINILRSDKIRAFASEKKTATIAQANQSSLEIAGTEELVKKFEALLHAALA